MHYTNNTRVSGKFNGQSITGIVVESRMIRNSVAYTVKLDCPIKLRWRDTVTDTILMDAIDVY